MRICSSPSPHLSTHIVINIKFHFLLETYGDEALFRRIEYYQDKWHEESTNYFQVKEEVDHLHSDVDEMRSTLISVKKGNLLFGTCTQLAISVLEVLHAGVQQLWIICITILIYNYIHARELLFSMPT